MQTKQDIEERVIARINAQIGSDVENLRQATTVLDHYKERLHEVVKKLDHENDVKGSSIKAALEFQKQSCDAFDFQMEKLQQFGQKLEVKIAESQSVLDTVETDLEQVRKMQQLMLYLRLVRDIYEISDSLKSALQSNDEAKCVNLYLTLYEDNDYENSVIGRLSNLEAPFLKHFAQSSAVHWHTQLSERLSAEFEAALKRIRWGLKEQDFLTQTPATEDIAKLQTLAEYLFLIKSPNDDDDAQLVTITPSVVCKPVSLVTSLLLAPYRQRFMYHFTGVRQTNRLDKPEWYFTQILNWGKEAHLFVGKNFQPAAIKAGKLDFNIRLEFLRGLVQLTIEKLAADIKEVSRDETLFAHLVDETLAFELELRELFGYPASFPSAISILTQPFYLLKWISLEERFCADQMDAILQAENPWHLLASNLCGDEEFKIPRCADQFVRLLEAVKDRYYALIQPGHQLQFLTLQLELIDNFRRRLVQLHSGGHVRSVPILNAVNYITMVLREWGENVHYLHLHAALVGVNANEINSVFEQPVSELEHWSKELLNDLALNAFNEIKAKSMRYRHDNWSQMHEQKPNEPFILSPSAGEMLQLAVTILHQMHRNLSSNLFNTVLRLIAKELDEYILNNLIMTTKFSIGGAAQFSYDMKRNLFVIFAQYAFQPGFLFKKIHDSITLLSLALGTAMLLHETLKSKNTLEKKLLALKELGISHLSPRAAIEVLERRRDINVTLNYD